jgi:hypothetical protein
MSGKNRAAARAAVKNGRRLKRHGRKPWMADKPVMKKGTGGTDKTAMRNNGRPPRYSAEPARR